MRLEIRSCDCVGTHLGFGPQVPGGALELLQQAGLGLVRDLLVSAGLLQLPLGLVDRVEEPHDALRRRLHHALLHLVLVGVGAELHALHVALLPDFDLLLAVGLDPLPKLLLLPVLGLVQNLALLRGAREEDANRARRR